jgi:hypothetical protein
MVIDSISKRRRLTAEVAGMRGTLLEMHERLYGLRRAAVMTTEQEKAADAALALQDSAERREQ